MKFFIIFVAFFSLCSARGARVWKGECIYRSETVYSDRNCFRLNVQGDGNMVIHRIADNKVIWSSNTYGRGGYKACMQHDGNFVLYDVNNHALWWTGTHNKGGDFMYLQDDAQLTIRNSAHQTVWVSGIVERC